MLGSQPVVDVQGAAADRLRDVAHQFAMGGGRHQDVTATMQVQEHAIGHRSGRGEPLRRHATGVDEARADRGRLGSQIAEARRVRAHLGQRGVGIPARFVEKRAQGFTQLCGLGTGQVDLLE